MDFKTKRVQCLAFIVGVIALSITAEKCRQLVGDDYSSQSGKFTIFNCFDLGSGTHRVCGERGCEVGMPAQDAAKTAQKEGTKAAKLAKRQAKRVIGPVISSGWDFFEALYYGGTMAEGFLRGSGTLVGAYAGGFLGDERLGRVGYLVGSHLGSWVGGRVGLMVYDVVNGVHCLLQFVQGEGSEVYESPPW
ncbi:hypothetical protein OIU85_005166 [Salix viminalis]|uniref:Uncharacterized protein n=1 Tax=Salix viminalis TaxID=40686 RepID=A0A9Q0PUS6_SALVM|nr:hypothetical protein OIU85_005166 [Salix viminalis]